MAQITITIPDGMLLEVRDAFVTMYNYQPTINGQPNPVTQNQFPKTVIAQFIRDVVKGYRNRQAQEAISIPDVTGVE